MKKNEYWLRIWSIKNNNYLEYMLKRIFLMFLVIGFLSSCNKSEYPSKVEHIIDISNNEKELLKAIHHFDYDSLKKNAVYFLIENMANKGSVVYREKDRYGNTINHNWNQYNSYSEAKNSRDDNLINIVRDTILLDINSIKADFLIENVENAFKVWNKSRSKNIDYADFLNFVLPYRDRNEELTSNWRRLALDKNNWIEDIQEENNLLLADKINNVLKLKMKFNYNYSLSTPNPSFKRLDSLTAGSCPYMTCLTIYYMRALGIPVTRDYVPYWTNVHHFSNHEWNAMLGNDGKWRGFMGCEENPTVYKPTFYAAKVFRETFSNNEIELHKVYENKKNIPKEFQRTNIIDVTHEYYETGDITLKVPNSSQDEKTLFLAIYNQKRWKPVYWGIVEQNQVTFKNMSKGVVYLLMRRNLKGEYIIIGDPFIFELNNKIKYFIPQENITEEILVYSFGLGNLSSKDYINFLEINNGYTLRYWSNNNWHKIDTKIATSINDTLYYSNVPKGSLLSLGRDKEKDNSGEQLFIYNDGKQIFY